MKSPNNLIDKHFNVDCSNPQKLEGNVIDYIFKSIRVINSDKCECQAAKLALLLKQEYPRYFRANYWAGFSKFRNMLEADPKHFLLYNKGENPADLWVRIKSTQMDDSDADALKISTPSQPLDCLSYIKRDVTNEECRKLREDIMMEYDECFLDDCVLRTRLIYMYHKAKVDGTLVSRPGFGEVFHTGLFKNKTDAIYFILTKYEDGTQTHLFLAESSTEFREMRRTLGNKIPEMPSFRRIEYKKDQNIVMDYGHIIKERYYRFPIYVFQMLRMYPDLTKDLRESSEDELALHCYNYFKRRLDGCLADTYDRLKKDADEPVPYWHRVSNQMCWLIPLRLGASENVDLALVLEPTIINGKEVYRGCTILPLKEAFKAARVVGKVSADWLKDAWME